MQSDDPGSPDAAAAAGAAGPEFDLIDPMDLLDPDQRREVAALARLGLHAVGVIGGEVRVRLLDDQSMSAAHAEHLGDSHTTDVLTFDLAGGTTGALDADLLVCVDQARRESAVRGVSLPAELVLYILHGVLHCLGHDDHTEAGARAMHDAEDEALERIGLGRVFSREPRGTAAGGAL